MQWLQMQLMCNTSLKKEPKTMKKIILHLILISSYCFLNNINYAQTPIWLWAKGASGISSDEIRSITIDDSGNAYIAGLFSSPTISFNSTTLTNLPYNGTSNLFLTKYDPNGNVIWAKSAIGMDNDDATSVATDADGNVYLAGLFSSNSLIFDSDTIINAGFYDIFFVKYDSSGNKLWLKSYGGLEWDGAYSIAIGDSENVYLAGTFCSSSITFGSFTLTNVRPDWPDIFLAKFDTDGNVLWAKCAGGSLSDEPNSIALDNSGNIYVGGAFNSQSLTFDSIILMNTTYSSMDGFLAKYDSNGNVIWAEGIGSNNNEEVYSITLDTSGKIYVAGYFQGSTLNIGSTILINSNAWFPDIFLAKYDDSGNAIWAKSFGGDSTDYVTAIALDTSDNILFTGYFKSPTIEFGNTTLTNTGDLDMFIAKCSPVGNIIWAKSVSGQRYDMASSIAVNLSNEVYMAGTFYSPSIKFDSITLVNTGDEDIFVAKLSSDTMSGLIEWSGQIDFIVSPNPSTDNLSIIVSERTEIEISNIEGQIIQRLKTIDNKTDIDISDFTNGVYIIRAQTGKGITTKKFIKE